LRQAQRQDESRLSTLCGRKRFLEAVTPAAETPQFIVDGEMFWGKDRMPQLEEWIGGW
jgi:hypothetical protein